MALQGKWRDFSVITKLGLAHANERGILSTYLALKSEFDEYKWPNIAKSLGLLCVVVETANEASEKSTGVVVKIEKSRESKGCRCITLETPKSDKVFTRFCIFIHTTKSGMPSKVELKIDKTNISHDLYKVWKINLYNLDLSLREEVRQKLNKLYSKLEKKMRLCDKHIA